MELVLTNEQVEQFVKDRWIEIKIGDYKIYLECDCGEQNNLYYCELEYGKTQRYAFNVDDLELLNAKKPDNPDYWHEDPLCPNCGAHLIYNFEYCPKCGQKLEWNQ